MTKKAKGRQHELFLNRELSWLAFNRRVLEEARDSQTPLLQRLNFAGIVASNLDEFFMVRVAALKNARAEGDNSPSLAGLTPAQQLEAISERAHAMVDELYEELHGKILPPLSDRGLRLASPKELEPSLGAALARYYRDEVMPALTPLAIDASRPFPMLAGLSLNLAVLMAPGPEGEKRLAVVQVPGRLPRLVRPPGSDAMIYVLLEDVIRAQLVTLFPGQEILDTAVFRVARDSELDLDDEGGQDFLHAIEEELKNRRRSGIVRLEVEASVSEGLLSLLATRLGVEAEDVYRVRGPVDLRPLVKLVGLSRAKELYFGGELVDAEEARRIGLVHRVVPTDALLEEAHETARKLAERAPLALGLTKRLLNHAAHADVRSGIEMESLAQLVARETADHREGVAAFREKRRPSFRGE